MSLGPTVHALFEEMRLRIADGRCPMPGCSSPATVARGFCGRCTAPVIGWWPDLPPETRRLVMLIFAVMLSIGDAGPLPHRVLWWRPEQSTVAVVETTDGLPSMPPYLAHFMTFGPEPRRRRTAAPHTKRRVQAKPSREPGLVTLRTAVVFN